MKVELTNHLVWENSQIINDDIYLLLYLIFMLLYCMLIRVNIITPWIYDYSNYYTVLHNLVLDYYLHIHFIFVLYIKQNALQPTPR